MAVSLVKRQSGQWVIKVRGVNPGSPLFGKVIRRSFSPNAKGLAANLAFAASDNPNLELMADYII